VLVEDEISYHVGSYEPAMSAGANKAALSPPAIFNATKYHRRCTGGSTTLCFGVHFAIDATKSYEVVSVIGQPCTLMTWTTRRELC
jgi:hypothetical protein